jgi:hypothetical protein
MGEIDEPLCENATPSQAVHSQPSDTSQPFLQRKHKRKATDPRRWVFQVLPQHQFAAPDVVTRTRLVSRTPQHASVGNRTRSSLGDTFPQLAMAREGHAQLPRHKKAMLSGTNVRAKVGHS